MLSIESVVNKILKTVCNGSGRGLIRALSQYLREGTVVRQDDRYPDRYSNLVPPHKYLQRWRYTNLNDHGGCDDRYVYIVT
jgi:hypothetical protein